LLGAIPSWLSWQWFCHSRGITTCDWSLHCWSCEG
jgi:hypothetical protein